MVGTQLLRVDVCLFDGWCQLLACQPIVNAPTNVSGSGICPVSPPSICVCCCWMLCAKYVNESSIQICLKAGSFLVGKAVLADVIFGSGKVDVLMSYVHVATV